MRLQKRFGRFLITSLTVLAAGIAIGTLPGAMAARRYKVTSVKISKENFPGKYFREYVEKEFYPLDTTCDGIRPWYRFDVSCQGTLPPAVTAFLEGNDFEDVVRTAVSLGGDSDTLACIAGAMAEAFYGVPDRLIAECRARLPEDMLQVVDRFNRACR